MVIRAAMRRRIRSSCECGKRTVASEEVIWDGSAEGSWKMKDVRVLGTAEDVCWRSDCLEKE